MNSDEYVKRNDRCIVNLIRKSSGKELEAPSVTSFFDEVIDYIDSDGTPDTTTLIPHDVINGLMRSPVSGYYSRVVGERLCEPCAIENSKTGKPCPEVGVFLDLVGFKGINDFLIYQAGDAILRAFAEWFEANISVKIKKLDWLPIHYGGDEFAIVGFNPIRPCDANYKKPAVNLDGIRSAIASMRTGSLMSRYIFMRMPFGVQSKPSVKCYIPDNGNDARQDKIDDFRYEENGYIRYIFTGLAYKFSVEETLNEAISALGDAKLKNYNEVEIVPRGMLGLSFYWGGSDKLDKLVSDILDTDAKSISDFLSINKKDFISPLKNMIFVAKVANPDSGTIAAYENSLQEYIVNHMKIKSDKEDDKNMTPTADSPEFSPAVTSCYRDGAILFRVDFENAPETYPCLGHLSDAIKRIKLEAAIVKAMNSKFDMLSGRFSTISLVIK